MSTSEPSVVRMGHDIVRNLAGYPDEEAAEMAATHIEKFWEPRMRAELVSLAMARDVRLEPILRVVAEKYLTDQTDDQELARPSGG